MKEKQWFEEWFDSPYYHILYADRDVKEAENFIKKIVSRLQIPLGANILDVACGKGRHSQTLARLGYKVTGIDLSKNNIAYARQYENENLKFEVWDMRCVYKERAFDYVFNLFSSFGYFSDEKDDEDSVKAFAGNLKPGGTLILDYINTECGVKLLKPKQIIQRGEIQFHIQKKVENGFIKKKIEFLAGGENQSYEEQLKIINLFRFEKMLQIAGLKLIQTFGDYDLNDFNAGLSPRLILVATSNQ